MECEGNVSWELTYLKLYGSLINLHVAMLCCHVSSPSLSLPSCSIYKDCTWSHLVWPAREVHHSVHYHMLFVDWLDSCDWQITWVYELGARNVNYPESFAYCSLESIKIEIPCLSNIATVGMIDCLLPLSSWTSTSGFCGYSHEV